MRKTAKVARLSRTEIILDSVAAKFKDVREYGSGFVSFTPRESRAVKRAAQKWPDQSLGKMAATSVRPDTPTKDGSIALSDEQDAYYIKEAIEGRHYRRGVHRI